jgi:hypothetical protein
VRRIVLIAALLTCSSHAASGAVPVGTAPDSGVSGQVRLDRTCGVRGGRCGGHRVAATVIIRERDTHRRVRTLHPRDGRFRARLRPGTYTLRATSEQSLGSATRTVAVRAHRFRVVVLRLHSPLRTPRASPAPAALR